MIDRLLPKARHLGTSSGTLRNCGHVGRLGEWAERIALAGLAGLVAVNDNGVLKCVAPPGGLDPCLSTNPLAIGVPTDHGAPWCSTFRPVPSPTAKSASRNSRELSVPSDGSKTPRGNPTSDPAARFARPPATILPMGGEQGYKGFGLGLLLDVLIGGLSGGFCPPAPDGTAEANNVLFVLWEPARFAGHGHFRGEAQKLTEFVRSVRRKPGIDAIRLPGDRANALRERRRIDGVPVDPGTWTALTTLAQSLCVPVPSF